MEMAKQNGEKNKEHNELLSRLSGVRKYTDQLQLFNIYIWYLVKKIL